MSKPKEDYENNAQEQSRKISWICAEDQKEYNMGKNRQKERKASKTEDLSIADLSEREQGL